MKKNHLTFFASALVCATFAFPLVNILQSASAEEAAQSSTQSAPATSWVGERGVMTTSDVVSTLGIAPTTEQRAQIDKAVAERNNALREINEKFSAALQKTLSANDAELAKRAESEKERRRMELIRRRQPGRYNGMKKDK